MTVEDKYTAKLLELAADIGLTPEQTERVRRLLEDAIDDAISVGNDMGRRD